MKTFKRIYIEITNLCNLNCSFCKKDNRPPVFMPLKDFKKILERIKGHGDYVYLHVKGEPLMHPELNEILIACYQKGIKVNITTNGSLLTERLEIIEASPAIRQISISLQSMEAQKDQELYLSSV